MEVTIRAMFHESNKENIPPVCTKVEKRKNMKNSIPSMAQSFKKNSKRKMKRIPLADITHLFENNTAPLTISHDENGVSSSLPSASVVHHSNFRRRTQVVVSCSRALRMGFR